MGIGARRDVMQVFYWHPLMEFGQKRHTPPNDTLQGFNVIDMIKSKIEEVCPATVSCTDILVLVAAREGIAMAGGPYYPLYTGRRDSLMSFPEVGAYELPSPHDDLYKTFTPFASRGFDERETVSILGNPTFLSYIFYKFFS
ncbi:hypothetical protein IFM89_029800 [Coptis chinensis]|uniref:Plant heme peroxidase family profile domain-containing protein n=1 Tax=Coptis chinensis TaxID=261450 RepID=A0A835IH81_9MAGN|nr:hypothetical protein IFM89_029800 [Coptis chinensis]